MDQYDVIVLGAGPAGYVCAIRCAQLGMKVACVDRYVTDNGNPALGGTCLNVGCIPSKALLDSSHHYQFAIEQAKEHGLVLESVAMNVSVMQKRKNKLVQVLTKGVASLLKKNKIDTYYGNASFIDTHKISIENFSDSSTQELAGNKIIIATGSKPTETSLAKTDGEFIFDSTGALNFQETPKRLGIIGAGVIGLEMGSVWNRLGSEVIILEALDSFLPMADQHIANESLKVFVKQGLDIRLQQKVEKVVVSNNKVLVTSSGTDGTKDLEVDKLIVAVGRSPNTDQLGLQNVGVKASDKGFVEVNDHWATSNSDIYAIGDVIGGPMLAHKGSEEGIALAEYMSGQSAHREYSKVPWVIYTWPEVAWVGKTEQECKQQGINYQVGSFPMMALGRARAMGDTTGSIKIIGEADSDQILGVHIFGANASELISEAVTAMEAELSTEDIARTIHAHPTLSEGIHEAALDVDKRVIHI